MPCVAGLSTGTPPLPSSFNNNPSPKLPHPTQPSHPETSPTPLNSKSAIPHSSSPPLEHQHLHHHHLSAPSLYKVVAILWMLAFGRLRLMWLLPCISSEVFDRGTAVFGNPTPFNNQDRQKKKKIGLSQESGFAYPQSPPWAHDLI